jgi:hypothetical protein
MAQKPEEHSVGGEAAIVSGMAVIVGAALFEWLVVLPDHPGYALLRVLGAAFAATLAVALIPGQ